MMLLQPCQGNQAVRPSATLDLRNDGNEPCEVVSKKDGAVYRLQANQTISIPLQKNLISNAKLQFTVSKGGRSFTVYGVVREGLGTRRNSVDTAELKPGAGLITSDENRRPEALRPMVEKRRASNPAINATETDPLLSSTENLINDRLGYKDQQVLLTTATADGSATPKTPHAQLSALQREASKRSKILFLKKEVAPVMLNVYDRLKDGGLKVRAEPSLYHDVGLREKVWEILEQYHPAWLNEGILALSTEQDQNDLADTNGKPHVNEKKRSLKQRTFDEIFSNQDIIDEQKEKRQGAFPENVDFVTKMSRHVVCKFLELVLLLDRAKQVELLKAPYACLFRPESQSKTSEQVLVQFAVIVFAGEGDILKHLRKLEYSVSHKQTALDEYETKIPKGELHPKLRDGVILALFLKSYDERLDVLSQLRIPAKERLHCLVNNEKVLDVIEKTDPALLDIGRRGKVTKYDLADSNKEKNMAFVWKLVLRFGLGSLIDENVLLEEIRRVSYRSKSNHGWKKTIESLAADEERGELGFQNLFSSEDDHQRRLHRLLLHWVQVVCANNDRVPKVMNFSGSIADGSALAVLIQYYHPNLISLEHLFLPDSSVSEGERLRKERKNFAVVNQAVDALGEIPIRLNSCNTKNPPAQQVGFACVAFLCARLLGTSTETKAAKKIQTLWMVTRARKMRTSESEKRARKLVRELVQSKLEDVMAAREAGGDRVVFNASLSSPLQHSLRTTGPVRNEVLESPSVVQIDSNPITQNILDAHLPSSAEAAVERARQQLEHEEEERKQKTILQEELKRERESRKALQEAAEAERRANDALLDELKQDRLAKEQAEAENLVRLEREKKVILEQQKVLKEEQEKRIKDEEIGKKHRFERDRRTRELMLEASKKERMLEMEKQAHQEVERKARDMRLRLEESKATESALLEKLARLEAEKDNAEKAAVRERREKEEAEKRITQEKQERDKLERMVEEARRQTELDLLRERGATAEQFALEQAKWLELSKKNSELTRFLEDAERAQQDLSNGLRLKEIEQEQLQIDLENKLVAVEQELARLESEIAAERKKADALEKEKLATEVQAELASKHIVRLEAELQAFASENEERQRLDEQRHVSEQQQLREEREEHAKEQQLLVLEKERLSQEYERIEALRLEQQRMKEQDEEFAHEHEQRLVKLLNDKQRAVEEEEQILNAKIEARKHEEEKLELARAVAERELRELEFIRQREEERVQELRLQALADEANRVEEERKLQEVRRANELLRQEETRRLEHLRKQVSQQEKENERRTLVIQKIDEAKRFIEAKRQEQVQKHQFRQDMEEKSDVQEQRDVLHLRTPHHVARTPRGHSFIPVGILRHSAAKPAAELSIEDQKRAKLVSWLQDPKYFSRIEEILLHDMQARSILLQRECLKAIIWSLRKCERSNHWELRCLLRSLAGVFEEGEFPLSDLTIHLASSLMDVLQTFYDRSEEFALALRIFAVLWLEYRDDFGYRMKSLVDLLDTKRRIQELCGVRDSVCDQNLQRLRKVIDS